MADGAVSLTPDAAATDPGRTAQVMPAQAAQAGQATQAGTSRKGTESGDSLTLSPEAKAQVAKLQARDTDVKAHEQAHMAAGAGIVTSGASYSYEKGPDGRSYAVGGEVSIDSSPVRGNPQATLAKALRIEAAALAPADPSGQDRAVASQAAAMASQAAAEAAKQGGSEASTSPSGTKGAYGKAGSLIDTTA